MPAAEQRSIAAPFPNPLVQSQTTQLSHARPRGHAPLLAADCNLCREGTHQAWQDDELEIIDARPPPLLSTAQELGLSDVAPAPTQALAAIVEAPIAPTPTEVFAMTAEAAPAPTPTEVLVATAEAAPAPTPTEVLVATAEAAPTPPATDAPALSTSNTRGSDVATFATQFVGAPYAWGGADPAGFDCSGFTQYVYRQFGLELPRIAADQYSEQYGTIITDPNALQPGDLVFFANTYEPGITHVGVYIANGDVVQAMNPGSGVAIESLREDYWAQHYYGALRPLR